MVWKGNWEVVYYYNNPPFFFFKWPPLENVQDWKLKKGHLRVPGPQLIYCIIYNHVLKMLNKSPWAPGLNENLYAQEGASCDGCDLVKLYIHGTAEVSEICFKTSPCQSESSCQLSLPKWNSHCFYNRRICIRIFYSISVLRWCFSLFLQ